MDKEEKENKVVSDKEQDLLEDQELNQKPDKEPLSEEEKQILTARMKAGLDEIFTGIRDCFTGAVPKPSETIIEIDAGPCPDLWTEKETAQYEEDVKERKRILHGRASEMQAFKNELAAQSIDMIQKIIKDCDVASSSKIYTYKQIYRIIKQIGEI